MDVAQLAVAQLAVAQKPRLRARRAGDCGGGHKRPDSTGADASHAQTSEVMQPTSLVEFLSERIEERFSKYRRDDTADHDFGDVEHCRHRRTGPGDHDPGPLDDRRWRSTQFSAGARMNPASSGIHRQTAHRTTPAFESVRFDQDVTELPQVSGQALHQPSGDDQPTIDFVAEHECGELVAHLAIAPPQLGQRQSTPRSFDFDGQTRDLLQLTTYGETRPRRHPHRFHRSRPAIDWSGAGDAARHELNIIGVRRQNPIDELCQCGPDVACGRRDAITNDHLSVDVDNSNGETARAQIDRQITTMLWFLVVHDAARYPTVRRERGPASTLPDVTDIAEATTTFSTLFESIVGNIATVVHGKRDAVEFAVIGLLAEGHLLIEDVPGVGKTSLAKALAASIDCSWKRVQFTPDLLPTDLVGVSVFERSTETFRFQPGPLFANIVLADEINRASPKTQSALLEAMEERQVSVDGTTYKLDPPFMVIATQNPVEQEGTYRLPESQLDRFLLRISLGYPDRTAEIAILDGQGSSEALREIRPVVSVSEVMAMVQTVKSVYLASALKSYLIDISESSRRHSAIELGLSPRATLQLSAAVRGYAAAKGRDYATPDDVKAMAPSALAHRLVLRAGTNARTTAEDTIRELLSDVPVPIAR